jgi:two-component system LytT family response regulator
MTYRALIVDDEPLARERMGELLALTPDFIVVGECATGEAAIEATARELPDMLLLDVQMPGFDGFAVAQALLDVCEPGRQPLIVFVTAHDAYALRAFEASAIDYLLKPVGRERFETAIRKARRLLEARRLFGWRGVSDETSISRLIDQATPRVADRFAARRGRDIFFLLHADVEWIDAAGNYMRLHSQGKTYMLRSTIGDLLRRLGPSSFLRIHRSAIVNLARVTRVQPTDHGEFVVTLSDGTRLNVSRPSARASDV